MNRLDRLIIQAQANHGEWYLAMCLLEYDEDGSEYLLRPQIWNGKPRECEQLPEKTFATRQEVNDAIGKLQEQYPSDKEPLILEIEWV